jgi:hypothetical protein
MSLTGTFLRLKAGIGAQNAWYAWVRRWMAARRMIAPAFIHGRVENRQKCNSQLHRLCATNVTGLIGKLVTRHVRSSLKRGE